MSSAAATSFCGIIIGGKISGIIYGNNPPFVYLEELLTGPPVTLTKVSPNIEPA